MAITATKLLTADDLLRLDSQGIRDELIRGVLHETTSSGLEHGEVAAKLTILLGIFIMPRELGTLATSDVGVWLEHDPDTVREPDIAYFSAARLLPGVRITGYAEVGPDLVVEIVSASDTRRAVRDKARMWLRYGVSLVWAVQPDTRTVDVYEPDQAVVSLTERDMLDGSEVLPGFTCPISDIFDT